MQYNNAVTILLDCIEYIFTLVVIHSMLSTGKKKSQRWRFSPTALCKKTITRIKHKYSTQNNSVH